MSDGGRRIDRLKEIIRWWEKLESALLPEEARRAGLLHLWRERILLATCLVSTVAGLLVLVPSVLLSLEENLPLVAVLDSLAYLSIIAVILARKTSFKLRAWALCVVLFLLGLGLALDLGLIGAAYLWFYAFGVISVLLLGVRAGVISLVLNFASLVLIGLLIHLDLLPWARLLENPLGKWIALGSSFMLINLITTISIGSILFGLQQALAKEEDIRRDLDDKHRDLMESNRLMTAQMDERREAEEFLRSSEQRFRDLFNSISDVIYTQDAEGRFLSVNQAFADTLGHLPEEIIGRRAAEFLVEDEPPAATDQKRRLTEEGRSTAQGLSVFRTRDGRLKYIEYISNQITPSAGRPYYSFSGRDVSERVFAEREMEDLHRQLNQAQKMEAIGTLAGGIAHDFNNILAAILGNTELALDSLESGSPPAEDLKQVLLATERARNLVRQILSFSRKAEQKKEPLFLSLVIKETTKLLRASIPATIDLQLDLRDTEDQVLADPVQVHQIVLNLCTNAAQAIGEDSSGLIELEQATVVLDSQAAAVCSLEPGCFQRLTVRDNGQGMDAETRERIFEPFFTTKGTAGTGMGLAVVYGIVQSCGGAISVDSRPGRGTEFTIHLPVIDEKQPSPVVEETQPLPTGDERILLVDDEEVLVRLGRVTLESLGYRVSAFTASPAALEEFKAGPEEFDLVITDYRMPQLSGLSLSRELTAIRPDIPIIISTGYSQNLTKEKLHQAGIRTLVTKPLSKSKLAQVVRRVLDGQPV